MDVYVGIAMIVEDKLVGTVTVTFSFYNPFRIKI